MYNSADPHHSSKPLFLEFLQEEVYETFSEALNGTNIEGRERERERERERVILNMFDRCRKGDVVGKSL